MDEWMKDWLRGSLEGGLSHEDLDASDDLPPRDEGASRGIEFAENELTVVKDLKCSRLGKVLDKHVTHEPCPRGEGGPSWNDVFHVPKGEGGVEHVAVQLFETENDDNEGNLEYLEVFCQCSRRRVNGEAGYIDDEPGVTLMDGVAQAGERPSIAS